jgi:hypothetical protein
MQHAGRLKLLLRLQVCAQAGCFTSEVAYMQGIPWCTMTSHYGAGKAVMSMEADQGVHSTVDCRTSLAVNLESKALTTVLASPNPPAVYMVL